MIYKVNDYPISCFNSRENRDPGELIHPSLLKIFNFNQILLIKALLFRVNCVILRSGHYLNGARFFGSTFLVDCKNVYLMIHGSKIQDMPEYFKEALTHARQNHYL